MLSRLTFRRACPYRRRVSRAGLGGVDRGRIRHAATAGGLLRNSLRGTSSNGRTFAIVSAYLRGESIQTPRHVR